MGVYQDDGTGALLNQPANQVAKVALITTGVITTAATSTTPFGFATAGQADAAVTAINLLVARVDAHTTALIAAGIMKSS